MNRVKTNRVLAGAVLLSAAVWSACSASGKTNDREAAPTPAIAVAPAAAVERPIARYIRVTGTLMAEEQADVAAETAGPVVSTPIERGHADAVRAELIRMLAT